MKQHNHQTMKHSISLFMTAIILLSAAAPAIVVNAADNLKRNDDGTVPILKTTDDGMTFNRPVYPNNAADNDAGGKFTNTMVAPNTIQPAASFQKDDNFGIFLKDYTSNAGLSQLNKRPMMNLSYTYLKGSPQISKSSYFNTTKMANQGNATIEPNFSQVNTNQRTNYLNDRSLAAIDFNAADNASIVLQFFYSVSVNLRDIKTGFLGIIDVGDAANFLNEVKTQVNSGLGYIAYVRVPDGYSAPNIVTTAQKGNGGKNNRLFLSPIESTNSNSNNGSFKNLNNGQGFNATSSNGSRSSLQAVDTHTLRFSTSSGTSTAYQSLINQFITDNLGGFLYTNALNFVALMRQDLPIQLQMGLAMTDLTANGDYYDVSPNKILTKNRKLPAVNKMTTINADFLPSDMTFADKTNQTTYYPTASQSDIDTFNANNSTTLLKRYGPLVMDNYLNGTGFTNNAHSLFKNIGLLDNSTTITNSQDSTGKASSTYSASQEFNNDYMNPNGGNSIYTWNQYISLHAKNSKYNTNTSENATNGEIAYAPGSSTADTTNLPGNNALDRTVTIGANDTFNPMDFYRSVNYFTKADTTADTIKNVTWAVNNGSSYTGPGATVADKSNPGKFGADPAKGTTKTIYYYGFDQDGIPFSPAKLTVKRSNYDVTASSTVRQQGAAASTGKTSLDVYSGNTVTERNTFTATGFDANANAITGKVTVGLPKGSTTATNFRLVNGDQSTPIDASRITKNADGTYTIDTSNITLTPSAPTLTLDYDYVVNGTGTVNTHANTFNGTANNTAQDAVNASVTPATLNILAPDVTLASVPTTIDFGTHSAPATTGKTLSAPTITYADNTQPGIVIDATDAKIPTWSLAATLQSTSNLPGDLYFYPDKNNPANPIKFTAGSAATITDSSKTTLSAGTNVLFNNLNFAFTPKNPVPVGQFSGQINWTLAAQPTD
ncbi:hypothetical protein [Lacticaseibacillus saniviri]